MVQTDEFGTPAVETEEERLRKEEEERLKEEERKRREAEARLAAAQTKEAADAILAEYADIALTPPAFIEPPEVKPPEVEKPVIPEVTAPGIGFPLPQEKGNEWWSDPTKVNENPVPERFDELSNYMYREDRPSRQVVKAYGIPVQLDPYAQTVLDKALNHNLPLALWLDDGTIIKARDVNEFSQLIQDVASGKLELTERVKPPPVTSASTIEINARLGAEVVKGYSVKPNENPNVLDGLWSNVENGNLNYQDYIDFREGKLSVDEILKLNPNIGRGTKFTERQLRPEEYQIEAEERQRFETPARNKYEYWETQKRLQFGYMRNVQEFLRLTGGSVPEIPSDWTSLETLPEEFTKIPHLSTKLRGAAAAYQRRIQNQFGRFTSAPSDIETSLQQARDELAVEMEKALPPNWKARTGALQPFGGPEISITTADGMERLPDGTWNVQGEVKTAEEMKTPEMVDRLAGQLAQKDVDELKTWVIENPALFSRQLQKVGDTVESRMVLKRLYPDIQEVEIKRYFSQQTEPSTLVDKIQRLTAMNRTPETEKELENLISFVMPIAPGAYGETRTLLKTPFGKQIYAGIGDIGQAISGALLWAGQKDIGQRVQQFSGILEAPQKLDSWYKPETYDNLAMQIVRGVPFSLALLPLSLVGTYAIGAGLAAAGVGGLTIGSVAVSGTVIRTILASIGAGGISRAVESTLEGGGTYNAAKTKGYTEEQAAAAAQQVFQGNMTALGGWDALQNFLAFAPTKGVNTKLFRFGKVAGKMGIVGLTEGGEEVYQELLQRQALGEKFDINDPDIRQVFIVGGLTGMLLGGGGEMITRVGNNVQTNLDPELAASYQRHFQQTIDRLRGETEAIEVTKTQNTAEFWNEQMALAEQRDTDAIAENLRTELDAVAHLEAMNRLLMENPEANQVIRQAVEEVKQQEIASEVEKSQERMAKMQKQAEIARTKPSPGEGIKGIKETEKVPREGQDIVSKLGRAFALNDQNSMLAREYLEKNVRPLFFEKFGDSPVMSITKYKGEMLLEINTAGWTERVATLGLEPVKGAGYGQYYRFTGKPIALPVAKEPAAAQPTPPEKVVPAPGARKTAAPVPRGQVASVAPPPVPPTTVPIAASTAGTPAAGKIKPLSGIMDDLSNKLAVPIRYGHYIASYGGSKAAGIYKMEKEIIRWKEGDLKTISHEVGHLLDERFDLKAQLVGSEIPAMVSGYGVAIPDPARMKMEAVAEFMKAYVTNPTRAQGMAPQFHAAFESIIPDDVKAILLEARAGYELWNSQPATAKFKTFIRNEPESFWTRLKDMEWGRKAKQLYTEQIDRHYMLSEVAKKAREDGITFADITDNPDVLIRLYYGVSGKINAFFNNGTFIGDAPAFHRAGGKVVVDYTGRSLKDALEPVKDRLSDFDAYLSARAMVGLADVGKLAKQPDRVRIGRDTVAEMEAKYPDFPQVQKEVRAFENRVIDYAAAKHYWNTETINKFKTMYEYYAPLFKVLDPQRGKYGSQGRGQTMANVGSPTKAIGDSELDLMSAVQGIMRNTIAIMDAVDRNQVGLAVADLAVKSKGVAQMFERVPPEMAKQKVEVDIKEYFEKQGWEIPEGFESDELTVAFDVFRPSLFQGDKIVTVMRDGKREYYQADPDLYNAIMSFDDRNMGQIIHMLRFPAKWLRAGAVLSPEFWAGKNWIRDTSTAFIFSKGGFVPIVDFGRGVVSIFNNPGLMELYEASGGGRATLTSMDRDTLSRNVKELLESKGAKAFNIVKHPLEALQKLADITETATRVGEFERVLGKTGNVPAAGYASREVTVDFARHGASRYAQAMNMMTAFWNANLVSTDRMIRAFKNNPQGTTFKAIAGITVPSILMYLANHDDDRWKELPRWEKDLFWIILPPGDAEPIRIPKPFTLGIVFGSLPERIMEWVETNDSIAFKDFAMNFVQTMTPNPLPTAVTPIIEQWANYDFFRGTPITSEGIKGLPKEEQSRTYTSETMKAMSRMFPFMSPIEWEHLFIGYTASLGKSMLQSVDAALEVTGISDRPARPTWTLADVPLVRAFIARNPYGSDSESVSNFYDKLDEYNSKERKSKQLYETNNKRGYRDYIQQHPELQMTIDISSGEPYSIPARFLRVSGKLLSDARAIERKIYDTDNLSSQQKRQMIDDIDKKITETAQQTLEFLKQNRWNKKISLKLPKVK